MTGIDIDADGVMKTGERIYNLERYYNNLCGFTGKDDTLPEKFLKLPGTGPAAGHVCELDKIKKEYYEARGWDDGVVLQQKLKNLKYPRKTQQPTPKVCELQQTVAEARPAQRFAGYYDRT